MGKLVNKVVQIGSFGLLKDVTGVEAGEKAAIEAGNIQAEAAQSGVDESRRQFDVTTEKLSDAEKLNRQQIELGRTRALSALEGSQLTQREQLDPFAQAGVSALSEQQALLGLSGTEAEAEALSRFTDSPGQAFRRERAQKNLLRGAASIGGLGGGNVRKALVEQGTGFAAQDFDTRFNRFGALSAAGQAAATNIGQGALQVGANVASTQFGAGQATGAGAISTAARQGAFGQANSANIQQGLNRQAEARASGILGGQQATAQVNQGLLQLGTTALFASDKKLKTNIKKSGSVNGFNWYSWSWNELGESLGLFGESQGVIANEVQKTNPELVGNKNGYLAVNYLALRAA